MVVVHHFPAYFLPCIRTLGNPSNPILNEETNRYCYKSIRQTVNIISCSYKT